jgi:hypothetical protein
MAENELSKVDLKQRLMSARRTMANRRAEMQELEADAVANGAVQIGAFGATYAFERRRLASQPALNFRGVDGRLIVGVLGWMAGRSVGGAVGAGLAGLGVGAAASYMSERGASTAQTDFAAQTRRTP